jgi:hypothetical protein
MKLQLETHVGTRPRGILEAGFSLLAALLFVLLVAFIAAAAMNLMRIRWAILGFIVAVILALLIVSVPDIKRYMKISSM